MQNATERSALIASITGTAWLIVEFMTRLAGGMYGKLMAVFFGG